MSSQARESGKIRPVESASKKEDLFTRQIRSHSSSKVTQFLNIFYSFVVGVLCAVAAKRHVWLPKTLGTLVAVVSYLYNRHASQLPLP